MASSSEGGLDDNTFLYHQLNAYPWDEDQEFQGGLRAILGSVQDPAQVEHLTLRARCYYYSRKAGTTVDFDGYKNWVENQQHATNGSHPPNTDTSAMNGLEEGYGGVAASDGGMGSAPKPASFAEICDMIAEGKPIPGIKDIPDTILEGQASESQKAERRKPWEKSNAGAQTGTEQGKDMQPSWMR